MGRLLARALALVVAATVALVLLFRVVDPPATPLMLRNAWRFGIRKQWVDLPDVAPALVRSVIAAEDARFFEHWGVDWDAVARARAYNAAHGGAPRRGASTITMQCARNVFLWQGKSYPRKALEIVLAHLLELAWGKRRILEVYLNVVEWGPGVYGAEAAARTSFGRTAADLDARQAALLAAALPNPQRLRPGAPSRALAARATVIARRASRIRFESVEERARR